MRYEAKSFLDKYGNEFLLRNAEAGDAADLIEYLRSITEETPYLRCEPEEVTFTEEQEQEFLQEKMDSDRELMLIAVADGRAAGTCSLMSAGRYQRSRHRCEVGIALYQEFCGRGIGTIMLKNILDNAKKVGYEQAELEVLAENARAIVLYEKLGFQKYGTFPRNVKYKNGKYADAYWMMKKL